MFDAIGKENFTSAFGSKLGVSLGKNSEFVAIAGTLYAESTPGMTSFVEMAAIGSVIRNRASANGSSVYEVASSRKSGIYGFKGRGKISNPRANPSKVNLAYKAAMYTLCSEIDYSNGAYFWQGKDFSKKGSYSNNEYYQKGFEFTSPKHDVYNMGSNTLGGPVPYKYESTAAAAGTIFMRLTETWMKAHGSSRWDGR